MDKITIASWMIAFTGVSLIQIASILSMFLILTILYKLLRLLFPRYTGGFCTKCNRYCRSVNYGIFAFIDKYALDVDQPNSCCCSCKHDY